MITFTDFMFGAYKTPELSEQYILPDHLKPDDIRQLGIPLDFRAAFAFPRKDCISLDELGRERNPTYSSSEDAMLVQAIWLVQPTQNYWLKLKIEHNKYNINVVENKDTVVIYNDGKCAAIKLPYDELERIGCGEFSEKLSD